MTTFVTKKKRRMYNDIFTILGVNRLWSTVICAGLAAVTPTTSFTIGIIIGCFFNVWCGMRADGVINIRCKNFRWRKFRGALLELACFLMIVWVVAMVTTSMGDEEARHYACKTISYCVIYAYLDNGMKNLCKAYPTSRGMWLIYLLVHLDLTRIFKINELMDKYESHLKKQTDGTYKTTNIEDDAPLGCKSQGE